MNRTILLIGPSGAGKSTAGQRACGMLRRARFESLDELAVQYGRIVKLIDESQGIIPLMGKLGDNSRLLSIGAQLVNDAESGLQADEHLVCDVGTGFLLAAESPHWVSSRRCLAVLASPEECHARAQARDDTRSLQEYTASEFSAGRQQMYDAAAMQVDVTGLDKRQSADRVAEALEQLTGRASQ